MVADRSLLSTGLGPAPARTQALDKVDRNRNAPKFIIILCCMFYSINSILYRTIVNGNRLIIPHS